MSNRLVVPTQGGRLSSDDGGALCRYSQTPHTLI